MLCCMVIFSVLLMTAVNVRAQCKRPDVGENQILTDEAFPDGSSVSYKCATGYVPVRPSASRTITCTGTQWSDFELQCKKKSCGYPGEIENGKYQTPEGLLFGATITAVCNEGHMLLGQRNRSCRERGWDGKAPACVVITCPKPPAINNGRFSLLKEFYEYGQTVTYSCNQGFRVTQPSTISCTDKEIFETAPQCLEITCESPSIKNAIINGSLTQYRYGVSIQIRCVEDYRIEGSGSLTCGEHGWIPSLPRCIKITCAEPKINNAVMIQGKTSLYRYKMTIQYRCNKGYIMDGSEFLTCKENGWNPPPPKCNIVTCPKPPDVTHGDFTPRMEAYKYGRTVTYSCRKGFRPYGATTISCTEHGMFDNSPMCLEITCESPSIENAVINVSLAQYRYGVSIQISCVEDYQIEGSDSLTCGEHGWIPSLPLCIASQPAWIKILGGLFGGGGVGGGALAV